MEADISIISRKKEKILQQIEVFKKILILTKKKEIKYVSKQKYDILIKGTVGVISSDPVHL